jgi:hypothetical protein
MFIGFLGYLLCNRSSNLGTSLLLHHSRKLDGYYGASMGDSQCVKIGIQNRAFWYLSRLSFVGMTLRGFSVWKIGC